MTSQILILRSKYILVGYTEDLIKHNSTFGKYFKIFQLTKNVCTKLSQYHRIHNYNSSLIRWKTFLA